MNTMPSRCELPGGARVYSITLSALIGKDCGIVSPSAFAVLPLITSSNWVDCSTGRSVGLAPRFCSSTISRSIDHVARRRRLFSAPGSAGARCIINAVFNCSGLDMEPAKGVKLRVRQPSRVSDAERKAAYELWKNTPAFHRKLQPGQQGVTDWLRAERDGLND